MQERLRTDSEALAMIEEYRQRFSSAPIGVWVDCIDEFMGVGFGGISGKFSRIEVRADGSGISADENETVQFEWRRVSERVIDVRRVEHTSTPDGWTDEEIAEDLKWHRVEYDFVVSELVDCPLITDVCRMDAEFSPETTSYAFQFLDCFYSRFGGRLRLQKETPRTQVKDEGSPPASTTHSTTKRSSWWRWWK